MISKSNTYKIESKLFRPIYHLMKFINNLNSIMLLCIVFIGYTRKRYFFRKRDIFSNNNKIECITSWYHCFFDM